MRFIHLLFKFVSGIIAIVVTLLTALITIIVSMAHKIR